MRTRIGFIELVVLLATATVCLADPRGVPPQAGITNFGKVNETLYRGAQPGPAQIATLKQMGIKSIINLRTSDEGGKAEALMVQTNGLVYTNVALNGIRRPTDDQVRQVLGLIETLPSPVFVHCQHGCDRTGTIIACYRIQHDGWTAKAALDEAEKYGISKLERGMRRYIADFGKAQARSNSKTKTPAEPATPNRAGPSK